MELQQILDAVLDGVIVIDADGSVRHLNAEACRILETSTEFASGTAVEELLGEEHPLAQATRSVMKSGRPGIEDDVPVERRFAGNLSVDVAVSPLSDAVGGQGAVIALRDRTIRNALTADASERDQLASYGHIAAGIAHEVKNPLGGIRGAAELLAGRADDDRTRRAADLIVGEVDRISALVEELMVFARGDALSCEPLNLHQVLDGVLELMAMDPLGANVAVERIYDPSIPDVVADRDRLRQVFLNLVRNGLQALEEARRNGGSPPAEGLAVTTRMVLEGRLSDTRGRQVPTVCVSIRDRGDGISKHDLELLSTPFFTTRSKGTGLGLAVSQHWIKRHGGKLRFASEPGRGTTVRILLPLRPLTPPRDGAS